MSRRGFGEGSIYQRESDGRWTTSVSLGYEPVLNKDGKSVLDDNGIPKVRRKRKVIYGKTRKEVAEQLTKLLRDQQQGLPIATNEKQTVGQFLTSWLEDTAKPNLRTSTYYTYRNHTNKHIIPHLGKIQLTKLTPQDVQNLLKKKLESNLAPRTVCDIHTVLAVALNQALKWSLVSRNVAALVNKPRLPKRDIRVFTPQEALHFLDSIKGNRWENLFIVALSLGVRRGEALGIRHQDIDYDRGILTLRVAIQADEKGRSMVVDLKTNAAYRRINLPPVTIEALRSQRIRQLEEKLKAGQKWIETGFVFTTSKGTPLLPSNYKRALDQVLERSGMQHMKIHELRHTSISFLIAINTPLKMISEIAGHSRISTTLDIYGHLFEPMRQEAAAKMDSFLRRNA